MLKITGFSPKKQGVNTQIKASCAQARGLVKSSCLKAHRKNENGSAIIWIFLAIGIFAALNFVISQGTRSGGAKISQEQARIAATEILSYARTLKSTVQTLQINGCLDTEISFDQAVLAGYSNPNAPLDESCHVFNPNGGGINYQAPDTDWLDSTKSALTHYGTFHTTGKFYIEGLGIDGAGSNCAGAADNCRELITGIPFIKKEICKEINKKIGWGSDSDGTPYKDTGSSYAASTDTTFVGAYATAGHNMGTATPSNYSNIMVGCVEGDTNPASGSYSFFQVLIVR